MKTLTLDLKKWRCGKNGDSALGEGYTHLLNTRGFMCCLGQFSLQLGATEDDIRGIGRPSCAKKPISEFVNHVFNETPLAEQAIEINDDENLTTKQRITKLKKLFSKHGFEIKVIE